jgi:hypothetical protein
VRSTSSDINLHVWDEFLFPYLEVGTVYQRIDFTNSNFAPIASRETAGNRLVGPHGIRAPFAALFSKTGRYVKYGRIVRNPS